jgi:hypothetical protein
MEPSPKLLEKLDEIERAFEADGAALSDPATSEVRPPCTVTYAPASRQIRSTAATSSALPGRTRAPA